jgi:hypothetical protein
VERSGRAVRHQQTHQPVLRLLRVARIRDPSENAAAPELLIRIDTTLTPPRAQYGATLGKLEQRKPFRYAGFATLGKPQQHMNYHS